MEQDGVQNQSIQSLMEITYVLHAVEISSPEFAESLNSIQKIDIAKPISSCAKCEKELKGYWEKLPVVGGSSQ